MTYSIRKSLRQCPRCIETSTEAVMCEHHRRIHAQRERLRITSVRARRRRNGLCASCERPSEKYRCAACSQKRKAWDAGVCA